MTALTGKNQPNDKEAQLTWTPEQQSVIQLRNRSMLVSAAAGSGKTAVLVERIVSMVTDPKNPIDIDRLLVVTFTNAAASEMRQRVQKAFEKKLESDPENAHLQRQVTLVHNAQITTIDSFCLNVIRNHFHRINLEPGFRIADEGELKLLREDVCDKVLDSFYQAGDPHFLEFIEGYSNAKSDQQIQDMMLRLYDYAQSYPWPDEWLASCVSQYTSESEEELEQKKWITDFLDYLSTRIRNVLDYYKVVYKYTLQEDGPQIYEGTVLDDLRQLEGLIECRHLSQWHSALEDIEFKRLPAARNYAGSEAKKTAVTDARNRIKKELQDLKKRYFSSDISVDLKRMQSTAAMVEVLVNLTTEFAGAFHKEKERKNLVDFHDVEHYALDVLVDPDTKLPTDTAKEYQQQFHEIMIDEYQDSNYVQETLLSAVSGISNDHENMFMVGDVKQSIYRFRLARPELFMQKFESFTPYGGDDTHAVRQRIDLHRNFRSRFGVIEIVNDIFSRIMGRDLGNVEYDQAASLYQGASFEDESNGQYAPECIVVVPDPYTSDQRESEARIVAQRIREIVGEQGIPGKTYKDIVILLRSLSGWAECFQKVFDQEGIPLIVSSRTGYFSAQEVQTVLSLLRLIDNPRQDIPMAAVMKSQIGGFTASEMAQMKAAFPDLPFYRCVLDIAGENERISDHVAGKIGRLKEMLSSFRARIPYTPIHKLLQQILNETGYLDYVTALPGGAQRRANLDMLLEKAISYEKTSYHGLFHFIRYIDRLMKYDVDYGEAELFGEQEDAVRLMTIHKSKGLEFPVVFVAGMGKQFNRTDSTGNMIFHPEYGIGLKHVDLQLHTRSDTLIRQIFSIEARKENLGEELRILYVALTRAKEKLILTGMGKEKEDETFPHLAPYEKLDFSDRMDASCYWDWVLPAIQTYGNKYLVQYETIEDRVEHVYKKQHDLSTERFRLNEQLKQVDESLYEDLDRQLCWNYPYNLNEVIRQKVSVSEIKHRAMEEYRALQDIEDREELFANEIPVPYIPGFIQEQEINQGALRGTAVHRFLELLDFAELGNVSGTIEESTFVHFLEDKIQEFVDAGRMQQEEAALLNVRMLYRFLCTETAHRMCEAARGHLLTKEQPFVMSLPASRVFRDSIAKDPVLIQGIIDVFWEEEDGIVLLDYKTDRVRTPDELIGRYREQLILYAEALNRFFKKKQVKEILIYSFRLDQTIQIE